MVTAYGEKIITDAHIRRSRLLAAVQLIQALGGGWSTADQPPKPHWDSKGH